MCFSVCVHARVSGEGKYMICMSECSLVCICVYIYTVYTCVRVANFWAVLLIKIMNSFTRKKKEMSCDLLWSHFWIKMCLGEFFFCREKIGYNFREEILLLMGSVQSQCCGNLAVISYWCAKSFVTVLSPTMFTKFILLLLSHCWWVTPPCTLMVGSLDLLFWVTNRHRH